jgi:hypothetical protein
MNLGEVDSDLPSNVTEAKSGVVLRRAVSSNARFGERAKFPRDLPVAEGNETRRKRVPKPPVAPPPRKHDDNTEAAIAYETSKLIG